MDVSVPRESGDDPLRISQDTWIPRVFPARVGMIREAAVRAGIDPGVPRVSGVFLLLIGVDSAGGGALQFRVGD